VLIPRPETEHVVEVALARMSARTSETLRVADVGTGSGCLTVALATELPQARIVATDISAPRSVSRAATRSKNRVARASNFWNAICSTRSRAMAARARGPRRIQRRAEIRRHRQQSAVRRSRRCGVAATRSARSRAGVALFAGESGLDFYAPLIAQAEKLLARGGLLVLELGYNAADHVAALLSSEAWREAAIANDLAGIARVASAIRK
jgi:release factor glutamine methyltransferase